MCSTVVGECVQYLGVLTCKVEREDRRQRRQKMRVKNFSRQRESREQRRIWGVFLGVESR